MFSQSRCCCINAFVMITKAMVEIIITEIITEDASVNVSACRSGLEYAYTSGLRCPHIGSSYIDTALCRLSTRSKHPPFVEQARIDTTFLCRRSSDGTMRKISTWRARILRKVGVDRPQRPGRLCPGQAQRRDGPRQPGKFCRHIFRNCYSCL